MTTRYLQQKKFAGIAIPIGSPESNESNLRIFLLLGFIILSLSTLKAQQYFSPSSYAIRNVVCIKNPAQYQDSTTQKTAVPVNPRPVIRLASPLTTGIVSLGPSKDNTIYQENQSNSNGTGEVFLGGNTGSGSATRGLISFDIAGAIPAGATITSVSLTLHCSNAAQSGGTPTDFELHKLFEDWGEGASNAGTHAGPGTPASANDATWLNTFYPDATWSKSGGSYDDAVSGTATVGPVNFYTWSSTGMIADVQYWLDNPSSNFGWILKSAEANTYEGRRFDSKENSTAANRPVLTVEYSESATPVQLNLSSLFLEGLYNGSGGMNKAQDESGSHFPGGVADHITLEIHDASAYGNILYSVSNVDLNISGQATAFIPSQYNGSYYLTVKHRNSIETVSALPVSLASGPVSYAFDSPSKAYGGNLRSLGGVYCIFAGDENNDGLVDASDMIDTDNGANSFATGYLPPDINGDGLVDASDMILIDNNTGAFISVMTP